MKKIYIIIFLLVMTLVACGQQVSKTNITIQKASPTLFLNGTSAAINFYNSDVVLQQSSNLLTLSGGDFSLGSNNLLSSGSIGMTGSRLLKGWFTDLEITNLPTINGGSLASALSLSSYLLKSDTATMLSNYALISEMGVGDVRLEDSTVVFATPTQLSDTMVNYITNATFGVALADSNLYNSGYVTRTYVESLLGSGTGMTTQRLPFIIGTTAGAPANGDTIVTHTSFSGKHIDLYRDGAKQYQNFTATNTIDGFRVSGSDVVVNPAWATGEQVIIDITEPVFWSSLGFEGEESSLLAGLSGYWKLDETSGTTAADATGTQNGYAAGTVGLTGKIGYSMGIDASNEFLSIAYNENVVPHDDAFSISMWVYLDSIPSTVDGLESYYLFNNPNPISPYEPHNFEYKANYDGLIFDSHNSAAEVYSVTSASALPDSTWHHIVFVNAGDGETLKMYVNGSDVSTSAGTFSGTLYESSHGLYWGNAYSGASQFVRGRIDECGIWSRGLTSGEITTLYNSGNGRTYPFE